MINQSKLVMVPSNNWSCIWQTYLMVYVSLCASSSKCDFRKTNYTIHEICWICIRVCGAHIMKRFFWYTFFLIKSKGECARRPKRNKKHTFGARFSRRAFSMPRGFVMLNIFFSIFCKGEYPSGCVCNVYIAGCVCVRELNTFDDTAQTARTWTWRRALLQHCTPERGAPSRSVTQWDGE